MIDRQAQLDDKIFSGITGIHLQDQAITESMGPIVDHDWEHLAPSDRMISQTRKKLIRAAKTFSKGGKPPPGSNNPELFLRARSGDFGFVGLPSTCPPSAPIEPTRGPARSGSCVD